MADNQSTDDILNLIYKSVEERVFSIEVLENITQLRKSVKDQEAIIKQQKETDLRNKDAIKDYVSQLSPLKDEVNRWKSMSTDLDNRELAVKKAETDIAVIKAKFEMISVFKQELVGLFNSAFKNPVVRQTSYGQKTEYVETYPGQPKSQISLPNNTTTDTSID